MAPAARAQHHPYGDVIDDIIAVGKRKEGWDGYHADQIGERAQLRAIELVNTFDKLHQRVPRPSVGGSADGGIVLRWLASDREVEIQFVNGGGEAVVFRRAPRKIIHQYDVNKVDVLKDVIDAHVLRHKSL